KGKSDRLTTVKSISSKLKTIEQRLIAIEKNEWDYFERLRINNENIDALSFQHGIKIQGDLTLGDIFDFKFGVKLYQLGKGSPKQDEKIIKSRAFEADSKIDDSYYPFLRARDVQKFQLLPPAKFIKYGIHLAEPRAISLFQGKRLLVQRIVGKKSLLAAFTEEEFICSSDVITLVPLKSDINLY